MQNKKVFFYVVQVIVFLRLVFNIYEVYANGSTKLQLVNSLVVSIHINLVWPITYLRFPSYSKYVFVSTHIFLLFLNNYVAHNTDSESILYVKTQFNETNEIITISFVIFMTTFNYCEFSLCFLYAVLYIVSSYLVSHAQRFEILALQAQLDDD
jgi:hypothetical protein